jgi:hypothetical protein
MKSMLTAVSMTLFVVLSACGNASQTSALKQSPANGIKTCDTGVAIPADPHEKVHATRIIFTSDMVKADVMEYAARALNLGTGEQIFDERYLSSRETYDLKKSSNQTIDLYSTNTQTVLGTIKLAEANSASIILKIGAHVDTLNCRTLSK